MLKKIFLLISLSLFFMSSAYASYRGSKLIDNAVETLRVRTLCPGHTIMEWSCRAEPGNPCDSVEIKQMDRSNVGYILTKGTSKAFTFTIDYVCSGRVIG